MSTEQNKPRENLFPKQVANLDRLRAKSDTERVLGLQPQAGWDQQSIDDLNTFKKNMTIYNDVVVAYGMTPGETGKEYGWGNVKRVFGISSEEARIRFKAAATRHYKTRDLELDENLQFKYNGPDVVKPITLESGGTLGQLPVELWDTYQNFSLSLGRGIGTALRLGGSLPLIGESLDDAGISMRDFYADVIADRPR